MQSSRGPETGHSGIPERVTEAYAYALDAADAAVQRAAAAVSQSEQAVALVEAVWWIGAADGYLWSAYGGRWRDHKATKKNASVIDGIYWARSMMIHDPLAMLTHGAFTGGYTNFATNLYGTHFWRELRDIQKLDVERASGSRGYTDYRDALAGRPMLDSLMEAITDLRFDPTSLAET